MARFTGSIVELNWAMMYMKQTHGLITNCDVLLEEKLIRTLDRK